MAGSARRTTGEDELIDAPQQVQHGVARRIPRDDTSDPAQRRFRRLDRLSWILDRSIPVGRWRIGLDPILGLMPGLGDSIGALLSLYVLYEGARLGAPGHVLLRITGNILIEAILGVIPLLGDVFDFIWQANTRNMALLHQHYQPGWQPRSLRGVWIAVLAVTLLVLAIIITLGYMLVTFVVERIGW